MVKNWLLIPASLLTAGLLMTACSTETDGTSVAASSSATEAPVDLALLDPGNYPTEPAAPYGTATTENILDVEGQRLAEFVTLPFEVDPELTEVSMPTMVIRSAKNLDVVLSPGVGTGPANGKMLYGYVSTASTPVANSKEVDRALVQMVLRYSDPAAAAAGAAEMHNALINNPDPALKEAPEKVGTLPNTLISSSGTADEVSLNAFTAHGDYVIYTWASAPTAEKDWTSTSVATALDLQEPLVDKFPATPTKEQNGGKSAMPEIDQNDILIYAVPEEDADAGLGNDMAVYGPRGMAHRSTNPALTYDTLTDAGAMHNAQYKTIVYRAATPEDAQEISDVFIEDLIKSDGYAPAPSPPGLPAATCVTKDTTDGTQDYCYVTNGRYVGEASALDDRTDLDQLISAQYLIFEKADQDAE
jgi:hypothetical protein